MTGSNRSNSLTDMTCTIAGAIHCSSSIGKSFCCCSYYVFVGVPVLVHLRSEGGSEQYKYSTKNLFWYRRRLGPFVQDSSRLRIIRNSSRRRMSRNSRSALRIGWNVLPFSAKSRSATLERTDNELTNNSTSELLESMYDERQLDKQSQKKSSEGQKATRLVLSFSSVVQQAKQILIM